MRSRIIIFCFFLLWSSFSLAMDYVQVRDHQGFIRNFSRLIMGTDHLAQDNWVSQNKPALSEEEVFKILDEAVKLGINVIDTSPIYVGNIEYLIGKWLQSRKEIIKNNLFYENASLNPDRKIYVISKGGFPFDLYYSQNLEPGNHSFELTRSLKKEGILNANESDHAQPLENVPPGTYASRLYGKEAVISERVRKELGHTLSNLGDNLTIYLMHRDDFDSLKFEVIPRKQTPVKTIMSALSRPEVSKHFSMLGWSNWANDRVDQSIRFAENNFDFVKPSFNSPYFSLFEMGPTSIHARGIQVTHKQMKNPEFQKGIYIMPYSPLGGFSILDKPEPAWENAKMDAKKKYDQKDPYWQNVYPAIFTSENEVRYYRALAWLKRFNLSQKANYTLDQLMNAYALAHARTDFLVVGPITIQQVRRTVGSLKLAKVINTRDLEYLNQVTETDIKYQRHAQAARACLKFYR